MFEGQKEGYLVNQTSCFGGQQCVNFSLLVNDMLAMTVQWNNKRSMSVTLICSCRSIFLLVLTSTKFSGGTRISINVVDFYITLITDITK